MKRPSDGFFERLKAGVHRGNIIWDFLEDKLYSVFMFSFRSILCV